MNNLLCDDYTKAKHSRERVKAGYGNEFYAQQAEALKHWSWGCPAPKSVVLGSLPYIGRDRIRLPKRSFLDYPWGSNLDRFK